MKRTRPLPGGVRAHDEAHHEAHDGAHEDLTDTEARILQFLAAEPQNRPDIGVGV